MLSSSDGLRLADAAQLRSPNVRRCLEKGAWDGARVSGAISVGLLPASYFPIAPLVIGMVSTHLAIPEVKVEAVLPLETVDVLDVFGRGVEEFA